MHPKHDQWALSELLRASEMEAEDKRPGPPRYNFSAISAMGLLARFRLSADVSVLRRLLWLSAQPGTAVIELLQLELRKGRVVSDTLMRSMLRLALTGAVYSLRQRDDSIEVTDYRAHHQSMEDARKRSDRIRRQRAVDEELSWHLGESIEPRWAELPLPQPPRQRHGRQLNEGSGLTPASPPTPAPLALDDDQAAKVVDMVDESFGGMVVRSFSKS